MRASTRHSLPPELSRSAPRDVSLTTGGRVLILCAWLLSAGALTAGVALHVEAQHQWKAAADFDRRALITSAEVDRLWRKKGDGKPAFAAFHFDVDGARIDGESRMQLAVWRELRTGSAVPVRYLPEDPRRFAIAGQRQRRLPFAVAYLVSAGLAALAFLSAVAVRRQRTLLSEGRTAPAVITAVRKLQGSHGKTHREIVYEFPVLAGSIATGKAVAGKTADVGTTISVVYDPEQPRRNRPYPFSLVTLHHDS